MRERLIMRFGYLYNGFINLGLGSDLDIETIQTTLLDGSFKLLRYGIQMKEQMEQKDLKLGIERVKNIIVSTGTI